MNMADAKFSTGKELEGMLGHAFEQGKLQMCKQLITYDQDNLSSITEQTNMQGEG